MKTVKDDMRADCCRAAVRLPDAAGKQSGGASAVTGGGR